MVISRTTESQNIWLVDFDRETSDLLTAGEGDQFWAVWTPEGDNIIFNWFRGSDLELWLQPIDRSRPPRKISDEPDLLHVPMDITPEGETVFLGVAEGLNSRISLHALDLGGDGKSRPLLTEDANVIQAKISPDGSLLAYASDRTDRYEVYVQPYPNLRTTVRVSPNGGQEPLWSPSGDRLYYRSDNGSQIFAVDIVDRDPLRLGKEKLLVEGRFLPGIRWGRRWDIDPGGERFLVLNVTSSESPKGIRVVRNWFTELEQLVPTEKN
jgi:Tol biopolymer transport system component